MLLWTLMLISAPLLCSFMLIWAYAGNQSMVISRGRGAKRRKQRAKIKRKRAICAAVCGACVVMATYAVINMLVMEKDYETARSEYEILRREYAPMISTSVIAKDDALTDTKKQTEDISYLPKLNPDFVGWLDIEGAGISYPVVQGEDNAKYLTSTFLGEKSSSGAIFMGYSHKAGFYEPLAVIHGHNMKDGSMFAGLARYLDEDYLEENPCIVITTKQGEILRYTIFNARLTDTGDSAYHLEVKNMSELRAAAAAWGAPNDTISILTLSTCAENGNKNARILLQAALVDDTR